MAKFFTRPPLGTPLNPAHRLNHGLVLYMPFGEGAGSKTQDLSGNGNHGTLTNMVQGATSGFTGGKFGGAMNFDGTNDYVNLGDKDQFTFTDGTDLNDIPFSISVWVMFNVITGFQLVMSKSDFGANRREFLLFTLNNQKIHFNLMKHDSYNDRIGRGTAVITANTQYHIVATYDGSKTEAGMRIYLNGHRSDNASDSAGTYPGLSNTVTPFVMGTDFNTFPTTGNHFHGSMSEVRVYRRALSAQDVQQLYTDPFCMYEQKNFFSKFIQKGSFFFSKK